MSAFNPPAFNPSRAHSTPAHATHAHATPAHASSVHATPAHRPNGNPHSTNARHLEFDTKMITGNPKQSSLIAPRVFHRRRHPTFYITCTKAAAQDFFQSDVVEYGSRYNRPDRFPRPKQAHRSRRHVDIPHWLGRLAEAAGECGFPEVGVPQCNQAVWGAEWVTRARDLRLLTLQGRLEEAFQMAEGWGLELHQAAPDCASQSAAEEGVLPHSRVMLAAVDAGDIALAFEYAALLPPHIDPYNLLMGAYAVRRETGAVLLGINTARRRGIQPDAMSYLIQIAAAAQVGNKEAFLSAYEEAQEKGFCFTTGRDQAWESMSNLTLEPSST